MGYTIKTMSEFKKLNKSKRETVSDYLSNVGERGGASTSPSKIAAAKQNGKEGGRPKMTRKMR